ncbi:MAG: hypothetical protein KBT03_03685 [Bacteroidales bacterium]|nr:hypothetical protein [Candidatus Scybalousia scybalohippi]
MANVDFIRGDSTKIDETPIVDGQILFDTEKQLIKMDNGNDREDYGGVISSLTEEEFLAHEEQYRADGKSYIVGNPNENVEHTQAIDVSFNKNGTNLESTTTQGAIVEVNDKTNELNSNLSDLKKRVDANVIISEVKLTYNTDYTAPSDGYARLMIRTVGAGSNKFASLLLNGKDIIRLPVASNEYSYASIFVKKGMNVKYSCGSGITDISAVACAFLPISQPT